MPWEAWYFVRGAKPGARSPFKWTYHFGFGVGEFYKTYVSLWNSSVQTNKKVGVLYPNDADGNAIRANLAPLLAKERRLSIWLRKAVHPERFSACVFLSLTKTKNRGLPRRRGGRSRQRSESHCRVRSLSYGRTRSISRVRRYRHR
jgi:hypothetical protein